MAFDPTPFLGAPKASPLPWKLKTKLIARLCHLDAKGSDGRRPLVFEPLHLQSSTDFGSEVTSRFPKSFDFVLSALGGDGEPERWEEEEQAEGQDQESGHQGRGGRGA